MFDIGGPELLVVGIVAILVVGPKDLPKLLRTVGQWVRRARSLAREFQSGLEEIGADDEIKNLTNDIRNVGTDFTRDMEKLTKVDPLASPKPPVTTDDDLPKIEAAPPPVAETVKAEPTVEKAKPKKPKKSGTSKTKAAKKAAAE